MDENDDGSLSDPYVKIFFIPGNCKTRLATSIQAIKQQYISNISQQNYILYYTLRSDRDWIIE